jgi:hypothetical protein
MKADISADTFRPSHSFSAVVVGQGQALLDSALNEQAAIARHRGERTAGDEIGAAGVPKIDGGFAVSVAPDGLDLLVSPGRMYVDGILCVNEPGVVGAVVVSATAVIVDSAAPDGVPFAAGEWVDAATGAPGALIQIKTVAVRELEFTAAVPGAPAVGARVELRRVTSLRTQPDRFAFDPFDATDPERVTVGAHRVELDVWHRHISPVEDPSIRELALGDAESSTRLKVVWQVRLVRAGVVGGGSCAIGVATPPGRLRASTVPVPPSDDACVLPDEGGYRGLENQLYRVEVHSASVAEVVLKWQRDNASMASRVVTLGTTLRVEQMGRDAERGFVTAPFVEVTDEALELDQRPGDLLAVSEADAPRHTIKLASAPTQAQIDRRPRARRWDGTIVVDLSSPAAEQPFALERGLQVALVPGALRPGDYWLIPARTSNDASAGIILWPTDDSGAPLAQAPEGIVHHVTSLAVVDADGTRFLGAAGNVRDCRRRFPALTAIEATDVGFDDGVAKLGAGDVQEAIDAIAQRSVSICSILVGPGEDLAVALTRLGDAQDALVCLRVGTYTLAAPLSVEGRRHIQFAGAGPGTRIIAPQSESALVFKGCTSVKVSNMHVSSGAAGSGGAAAGVNGTLTFIDCAKVTVEGTGAQCAGGPPRVAACISVRNSAPAAGSSVRVDGCELTVGHLQIGVIVVNVGRVSVSDNVLLAGVRPADAVLVADVDYRGLLRRQLISHMVAGAAAPAGTNATVHAGNQILHFRTVPGLIVSNRNDTEWQRAIDAIKPTGITSPRALKRFLLRLASRMVQSGGVAAGGSPRFASAVAQTLARDVPAIGQGVVVSGSFAEHVRIDGNAIRGAIQGIHIGVGSRSNAAVGAGAVAVKSNAIHVSLPPSARRERHGIFVGNADSISITANQLHLTRAAGNEALQLDGIRIFGRVGLSVIVSHNHLHGGFTTGVTFAPLNQPLPDQPMWIVRENVMQATTTKVTIPIGSPGHAGVNAPAVTKKVRGLADNFA